MKYYNWYKISDTLTLLWFEKIKYKKSSHCKWTIHCSNCWYKFNYFISNWLSWLKCKCSWKKFKLDWDSIIINTKNWDIIWDIEDKTILLIHSWYVTKRRSVEARIWNKLIKLHRLLLSCEEWLVVDHINWNFLDNRKINLRKCTIWQNTFNQWIRKNKNSKYKWVYYDKYRNRYCAKITKEWKTTLKYFDNELEWALFYNKNAIELFWEYARLNEL